MDAAVDAAASDPDVEPPVLLAEFRPENHPLAGVFEDWAWLAVWTAKWLREQRLRKKCEQRRNQRARRACRNEARAGFSIGPAAELPAEADRRDCAETADAPTESRDAWRSRVRLEAGQRRERLREEARLQERWAKEEEIDDEALLAIGFAGGGRPSRPPRPPPKPQPVSPFLFDMSAFPEERDTYVNTSPIFSRTASPASTGCRGDDSSATSRGPSLSASLASSPGIGPCLNPLGQIGAATWVSWAQLLSHRHELKSAAMLQEQEVPAEPPPGRQEGPGSHHLRPAAVPELIMRKLSLLSSEDLMDVEENGLRPGSATGSLSGEEDVWDDMAKRWRVSLEGMEVKAHQQISDLLHDFVGPEEFRRLDGAASVQRRLLQELIQVHDEQDLDMDVWSEAQSHAVAQILEGGSQSNELANVPVTDMEQLLNNRGYELPEPQKAQNLGRGSFGRVLKVRRTNDGQLFAMKRQFLGDFADDMVPVLRETSILNLLKGAGNVVQIEDAFLMRPLKGAAEVWSVLEHFPHNMYKVRHRFRSEEAARRVVFQVLLGLHSLHSADIVHRDLKPDNVLVDLGSSPPYTFKVALCDFNTSRSVHGFPSERPELDCGELPQLPLVRSVTDRVTTSWWRAPEMWGWADTRQMTKRDLKSLDVFALGLVWAELLAVKSVLQYWEGVDPPKFRLLEILQKVDRPTDADLHDLGFSDDISCFVVCALKGDMEALRPEMTSADWPKNQEVREALLAAPHTGISAWVKQNAWQDISENSRTPELIARMARFSYRERPTVEKMIEHQFFSDLRAEVPQNLTTFARPSFDDVREAIRSEHEKQGLAAQRARELRELRGDGSGGDGVSGAQDAFLQRMAANSAAEVEESVRSVCARVRTAIKETQKRGPRGTRGRPSGCQGYPGASISHSHVPR